MIAREKGSGGAVQSASDVDQVNKAARRVKFALSVGQDLSFWLTNQCVLKAMSGQFVVKLFRDQRSPRFRVEIIEELVATGGQGSKSDNAFAISCHDFFNPQAHTLKFHRCQIQVPHPKLDWHVGWRMNFARLKTVVPHADRHVRRLLRA